MCVDENNRLALKFFHEPFRSQNIRRADIWTAISDYRFIVLGLIIITPGPLLALGFTPTFLERERERDLGRNLGLVRLHGGS